MAETGYGTVRMQHGLGCGTAGMWQGQDMAQQGCGTAGMMWHSPAAARPHPQCDREPPNTPDPRAPRHPSLHEFPPADFPSSHTSPLASPQSPGNNFSPARGLWFGFCSRLVLTRRWEQPGVGRDCFPFHDLAEKPVWVKTRLNPSPAPRPAAQRLLRLSQAGPNFGTRWVGFPSCGPSDSPGGPVLGRGHEHPPPSPVQKGFGPPGWPQGAGKEFSREPNPRAGELSWGQRMGQDRRDRKSVV